jgi:hypothetical protein
VITIRSNIGEVTNRIILNLQKLEPTSEVGSQIVRTASLNVLAELRDRIQLHGLASDNTEIGNYSRKPFYVSAKANPGKTFGRSLGKPFNGKRRSVFESGKKKGQDHTSRYFERGYDEFKTTIGRNQLGKVNLTLTGNMMNLLAVFPTEQGWGIGWADTKFARRARFFERKYGKSIFNATPSERKLAIDTVKRLLANAIS